MHILREKTLHKLYWTIEYMSMKSLENKKLIWIWELLMEIYEWAGKKKTPAFKELMQRAHVNAMKNREKNFSEDALSIYSETYISHKEPNQEGKKRKIEWESNNE